MAQRVGHGQSGGKYLYGIFYRYPGRGGDGHLRFPSDELAHCARERLSVRQAAAACEGQRPFLRIVFHGGSAGGGNIFYRGHLPEMGNVRRRAELLLPHRRLGLSGQPGRGGGNPGHLPYSGGASARESFIPDRRYQPQCQFHILYTLGVGVF